MPLVSLRRTGLVPSRVMRRASHAFAGPRRWFACRCRPVSTLGLMRQPWDPRRIIGENNLCWCMSRSIACAAGARRPDAGQAVGPPGRAPDIRAKLMDVRLLLVQAVTATPLQALPEAEQSSRASSCRPRQSGCFAPVFSLVCGVHVRPMGSARTMCVPRTVPCTISNRFHAPLGR